MLNGFIAPFLNHSNRQIKQLIMNNSIGLIITASNQITSDMTSDQCIKLQREFARRAKNREHITGMFQRNGITPYTLIDTTVDNFKNTINDIFKDNDEDCISYVYINCHGSVDGLAMVLDVDKTVFIPYTELKGILNVIKGTVVLMIEACHSGASITAKKAKLRNLNTVDMSTPTPEDMNKAIISAFSAPKRNSCFRKAELRTDNYQVITACHADENAWGDHIVGNDFTNFWCEGAGWDYKNNSDIEMLADTSNKGYVTLQDLCNYTNQQINNVKDPSTGTVVRYTQNDMCYPENSDFPVFVTAPISLVSTAIEKYYRRYNDIYQSPIGSVMTLPTGIAYQDYEEGVIVRYPNGKVEGFTRLSYVLNQIRQVSPDSE